MSSIFFSEFASLSLVLLFTQKLQLVAQEARKCLESGLISQIVKSGMIHTASMQEAEILPPGRKNSHALCRPEGGVTQSLLWTFQLTAFWITVQQNSHIRFRNTGSTLGTSIKAKQEEAVWRDPTTEQGVQKSYRYCRRMLIETITNKQTKPVTFPHRGEQSSTQIPAEASPSQQDRKWTRSDAEVIGNEQYNLIKY